MYDVYAAIHVHYSSVGHKRLQFTRRGSIVFCSQRYSVHTIIGAPPFPAPLHFKFIFLLPAVWHVLILCAWNSETTILLC